MLYETSVVAAAERTEEPDWVETVSTENRSDSDRSSLLVVM